ncbi:hypothetical protein [Pseudomonas sp. RA_5y_Pfl1_P24]
MAQVVSGFVSKRVMTAMFAPILGAVIGGFSYRWLGKEEPG